MIIIQQKNRSMPFSHGILAISLLRAGMSMSDCISFTQKIQSYLVEQHRYSLSEDELARIIYEHLDSANPQIAKNYLIWRRIRKEKLPIIVLIGGVTGIGKSTVGREVAYRLGIGNVIGSDSIREVLRRIIPAEIAPTLHESSFQAYINAQIPGDQHYKLTYGFQQQTQMVNIGVNAIISRSIKEGYNLLIEGIHLVPGYYEANSKHAKGFFHFVLDVPSVEEHKSRLYSRSDATVRQASYYIEHLSEIEIIKEYIKDKAKEFKIPIIVNEKFEQTATKIIDDIIHTLTAEFPDEEQFPLS